MIVDPKFMKHTRRLKEMEHDMLNLKLPCQVGENSQEVSRPKRRRGSFRENSQALQEPRRKLEVKRKSKKSPGLNSIQFDPQVNPADRLVTRAEWLEPSIYKNQPRPNGWIGLKGTSSSSRLPPNPIILKYTRREAKRAIHFDLQPVTHEYLKWSRLSAGEKNAYNERISKLQNRQFGVPRLVVWNIFADYGCEDDLLDMMKIEYMHDDGDVFEDH
ncbi:hypothetical protein Tco_0491065 [Tanacetum coccineum]